MDTDIIAVDVGNSRIKIGWFKNKILKDVFITPTNNIKSLSFPSRWKSVTPISVGTSSVVPSVNPVIKSKILNFFGQINIIVIKPGNCNIPLKIKNKNTVGVDRVLNCVAALKLFAGSIVIVDIGTAITIDIVSKKGEFVGGLIIPGPSLWSNALTHTAMINKCKITEAHTKIPGKNTDEAISAGIRYGIPGAINNILEHVFKKYPSAKLVLTGGESMKFYRYIRFKKYVRQHLTLEGINYVISENSLCYPGK